MLFNYDNKTIRHNTIIVILDLRCAFNPATTWGCFIEESVNVTHWSVAEMDYGLTLSVHVV